MFIKLRAAKTPPEQSGHFPYAFGMLGGAILVLLSPFIAIYMLYCALALGSKKVR